MAQAKGFHASWEVHRMSFISRLKELADRSSLAARIHPEPDPT